MFSRSRQAGSVIGREVVLDAAHQVHRDAVQAVVRVDHGTRALRVIDDTNATLLELHRLHLRVQSHVVADLAHETCGHAVHAPDRLHHHGGLIVHFAEAHEIHEFRLQQLMNVERLLQHLGRGRIVHRHAGAQRTAVLEALIQIAELTQIGEHALVVAAGQRRLQILWLDRFRRQLGDESARISDVIAIADATAAKQRCIVYPGIAVIVDKRLERNPELAAIAQQRGMVPGYARRAGIEIQVRIRIELAAPRIADLVDQIAVTQRQIAATGAVPGFQDDNLVPLAAQLVG